MQKINYDAQSIKVLKGLDVVKKRPGMYIGDVSDGSGLHHMVYEIIDNSIDESLAGYCNKIVVTLNFDNSITIFDNGRGIPIDIHTETKSVAAEIIITQLHTGGKFDLNTYKTSGGLHGVGISVVNALSKCLKATIWRDNMKYNINLRTGFKKITSLYKKNINTKRGTEIRFAPSKKIFSNTIFNICTLENKLRELTFLNSHLSIILDNKKKKSKKIIKLKYNKGILDFIKYVDRAKTPIHNSVQIIGKINAININICFQWNQSFYEKTLTFTNNIKQQNGGVHLSSFRAGLTRAINQYIENNQIIKKKIVKLLPEDIREGLTSIISLNIPNPKFSSQTKDKLINSEIRGVLESFVLNNITIWLEKNPKNSKTIISKIIDSALVRESTKKVRDISRNQHIYSPILSHKLAACQNQTSKTSELFLVEGDSAGGSAKQARDRKIQAILPLRGKILNVEKARLYKILDSNEICTLITAIRANIKKGKLDLINLRYNKIIIMTDADVDGAHIKTLLLTFFFRYAISIIENGHLYIAQPPLYKIKYSSYDIYIKDEKELQFFLRNIVFKFINIKKDYFNKEKYIEIIHNLIDVYNVIYKYSYLLKAPTYIIESLLVNNFSYLNKKNEIKRIIFYLETLYKKNKIKYKIKIEQRYVKISQNYNKIVKIYKISNNIFENKFISNILQKIKISINKQKIIYDKFFIKSISIYSIISELFKYVKSCLYIQRFKGLGEMNPSQLWNTTLDPKNRVLLKINIKNILQSEEIFSVLMGNNVNPRRNFIINNALKTKHVDV